MTSPQRRFEDVVVGEELPPGTYPLTVYRLVMAAGATRDFNSIHHNSEYARATGAAEMYANTTFLLGMWERTIRDWLGDAGGIRAVRGFRMRSFNHVGDTTVVRAAVLDKRVEEGTGVVVLRVHSENASGVTVGPGEVEVTLPLTQATNR
jgi:acyl dehydratase